MSEQSKITGFIKSIIKTFIIIIITVAITIWAVTAYLFPNEFNPVQLSQKEQHVLSKKLENIGITKGSMHKSNIDHRETLKPEAYKEDMTSQELYFSEREINALIANNTDLASKLAIDLDDDLISAKLRFPLDQDMPFFGGKILNASAGVEFKYTDGKPAIILKGLTIWGIAVPNAWIGGLRNIDLIQEFGEDDGFWQSFANGIDGIKIMNEHITIKLKK